MAASLTTPTHWLRRPWVLGVIALVAMVLVLRNGLVSDDVDLLVTNGAVHSWTGLWHGFTAPYWPPPSQDGLYRPLMISFFTAEWILSGGNAVLLHLVSLILYVVAVLAVWGLLRRVAGSDAAALGTLLFAVTPIHVEAVAAVVSQGELVVGALAAFTATAMIDAERGQLSDRTLWWRVLAGVTVGLGFKEHAVMLPWLLVLIVAILAKDPVARLRARGPLLLTSVGVTALFWLYRSAVLGNVEGAAPALGLPATAWGRLGAMLGVIPTWTELLFFPTRLRIDYGPRELPPYSGDSVAGIAGVVILLLWVAGVVAAWRHSRPVALALVWVPVALLPVSNVVIPTGIWIGERTLFLASIGVAMLVAAAMDRIPPARSRWVALAVVLACIAGMARSILRMPAWRSQEAHLTAMLRDSPNGYRANLAMGTWAFDSAGDRATGERYLLRALELWPDSPEPYQALGDQYRSDAICAPAERLYGAALERWPGRSDIRISMIACLFFTGDWAGAAGTARADGPAISDREWFVAAGRIADSAGMRHLPPNGAAPPPAPATLTNVGRSQ